MSIDKYPLIIFDWDGTLIDSETNIVQCMHAVIRQMQLDPRTDGQVRHIIGLGMRQAILELYPDLSEAQIREFAEHYRHYFLAQEQSPPFPGVEQLLQRLKAAGHRLAVATGKGRRGLDAAFHNLDFGRYFHASRCADETRSKPHPQMLQELLQEFGLAPSQALMIGDTSYDLDMAREIQMDAIAVGTGVHSEEVLQASSPKVFLQEVNHLWDWLQQQ